MISPKSVKALEELGRVRLSNSFFMRDFLYSEISQIEGVPNIPENPDIAIQAGTSLCQKVLEPIQASLGRISIRSAYRSPMVNGKGAENRNQYNCSSNENTYGHHIWDYPDKHGKLGATACMSIVGINHLPPSSHHTQIRLTKLFSTVNRLPTDCLKYPLAPGQSTPSHIWHLINL